MNFAHFPTLNIMIHNLNRFLKHCIHLIRITIIYEYPFLYLFVKFYDNVTGFFIDLLHIDH